MKAIIMAQGEATRWLIYDHESTAYLPRCLPKSIGSIWASSGYP